MDISTQEAVRVKNEVGRTQNFNQMKSTIENISMLCDEYKSDKAYKKFNKVTLNGSTYECQKDCRGIIPSDTNIQYWFCIAKRGLDGKGSGDMNKVDYDKNNNGIVDNAEKVNGFAVECNVPKDANFTDTIYMHPESHPASIITEDDNRKFISKDKLTQINDNTNRVKSLEDGGNLKNLTKKVEIIETTLNDFQLKSFETDVLLTKLEGCNGGFVSTELQGRTLVNLSKFTTIETRPELTRYISTNLNAGMALGRTITIINNTGRKISGDINESGKYKRLFDCLDIATVTLTGNEILQYIFGYTVHDWTDANKSDLLKIMLLDGEVKTPPNYFEGMQSVGELVTLQAKVHTVVTGKQFVDIEIVNIYSTKIGDFFNWEDNSNIVLWTNIKVTNIVGNMLSLDFGKVVSSGQFNSSNRLVPDTPYYKIEILSKNKNLFDMETWYNTLISGNGITKSKEDEIIKLLTNADGYSYFDSNMKIPLEKNKDYMLTVKWCSNVSGNADWLSLYGYANFPNDIRTNLFIEYIQIEQSTISTIYEPYKEDKTEILLKEPFAKWNKIDDSGKVEVGSKEVIFDGSIDENWTVRQYSNLIAYIQIDDLQGYDGVELNAYSDKLPSLGNISGQVDGTRGIAVEGTSVNFSGIFIGIKGIATDVASFRTWLSNNPIKIIYKLKDSTKTYYNVNKTLILGAYPEGYFECR